MTQLEITTNNYKKIIEAINNNKISSQKELADIVGLSPSIISQLIKRIHGKKQHIFFKSYYYSDVSDVSEIEEVQVMKRMIAEYIANPCIEFYQAKYLMSIYEIDRSDVQRFLAYVNDLKKIT